MSLKTKTTSQPSFSEDLRMPLATTLSERTGGTKFPTGESKRNGGTFDTEWEVKKHKGWWIGSFVSPFIVEVGDRHFVAVMPAHDPWELAVDAFLDFIDRLREGRIPRDVTEPLVLMDMCCYAARRQR